MIDLRDEASAYQKEILALGANSTHLPRNSSTRWDAVGIVAAFKAVTLEGVEVIVIGLGAVRGLLVEASLGALAACLLVAGAGAVLRQPLARVPENTLKLTVGILMSAFDLFWFGEGVGLQWPFGDAAILGLMAMLAVASWLGIRVAAQFGESGKRLATGEGSA